MYKEHFAVQRPLFGDGVARDSDVFLGPRQQLAAANLKIALSTRDSVAVLSGPAGVGKTTIASYAIRAATTRLALGWLGTAPLTPHELLEQLLTGFEFSPYKSSRVERMQVWRQFLNEMSITETRVCVLVENAQEYTPDVLRALGSLSGADPNGCPGANLILTSTVPARELLSPPGLDAIKQRMRLSARVEPFNAAEMEAYLRQRCALAGAEYDDLFAAGTAAAVQQFSGGLLRVANNLCETALTVAATRKEPRLGPDLLTRVAVGLFGMEPPTAAPVAAPSTADAAERRHPIVGARAIATAAMMAAEASLEPEPDETPEPAAAASDTPGPALTAESSERPEVETEAPGESAPVAEDLDAHESEPSEPDTASDAPAADTLTDESDVPTVSDAVEPAADTAAQIAATGATAPANAGDDDGRSASTVEFEASLDADDPFAVDEALMTEAAADDGDDADIDLPVLTDTVEPTGDVAAAILASDDDVDDAALASTLAGLGDTGEVAGPDLDESDEADGDDGLAHDLAAEAAERRRDAQAAIAHAKALEDISNSMAETLFGDAELAELSATLAIASADAETDVDDDEASFTLELEDDDDDDVDEAPAARSQAF